MKYYLTPLLFVVLLGCSGKGDNNVANVADSGGPLPDTAPEPDMAVDMVVLPDVPAEPGSLVIDPRAITFSDVRQGESASAVIGISNIGGTAIVVTGVQLLEFNRTGEPEFVKGDGWNSSFLVGPGLFKELEVVYEPKDFGVDQGRVELFTNDPENEVVQVRIETVSAYAQLEGPGLLRFGEVANGDSVTTRITFYNRGLDALTIDSVDLGGITGFFAIAFEANATPPTVLERDEDFVIDVTYAPIGAATHRGTITVNSDAPDQPTFDVALVGNDPSPCLDITPDAADFGEVAAATPQTQQITLLNCSQTLMLDISEIALSDDGDGAFSLANTPMLPRQLPPLQTLQFSVAGTLGAPGVATGEVAITSTDTKSDGTLALRLTVPDP